MAKRKKSPRKPPNKPATWLARWKRDIAIIRDKIDELWADREAYREYREIVVANPRIDKTAPFLHVVDAMYVSHVLTAIRTFDDRNSLARSLRNLLREIRDQAPVLTRSWFVARFAKRGNSRIRIGEKQFREHWSGTTHISAKRVDADMRKLCRMCLRVKTYVDKRVAHNDRVKPIKRLTHADIDLAINGIHELVSRYHALLLNKEVGPPACESSDHIFKIRWI